MAPPNPFASSLSCSVQGVSLAWGSCSDMGASDWFAANGGKGQVALCAFLLFSQSHCYVRFSTANTFYYCSERWEVLWVLYLDNGIYFHL